jgi:hypothetical protein
MRLKPTSHIPSIVSGMDEHERTPRHVPDVIGLPKSRRGTQATFVLAGWYAGYGRLVVTPWQFQRETGKAKRRNKESPFRALV